MNNSIYINMSGEKMKIAIIGLGNIAQKAYLPIMSQLPNVEIVLCSRSATTLNQLGDQYRIKERVQDYKMLSTLNIDGVMIHSSTASHPEIAAFFIKQGIPTFVDKPLASNIEDCEKLHELAEVHQTLLYMGFNRRFIPLFNQHLFSSERPLLSLRWEKNRFDLAGELQDFIFDDFIHALDSVNIFAKESLDNMQISTQFHGEQLARLDVSWQERNTILHASMNRMHGMTNELVSANFANCSYQFDSFVQGQCFENGTSNTVLLPDWTSMLASKGFVAMIDDWIKTIEKGALSHEVSQRNIATHRLADKIFKVVKNAKA